MSVEIKKCNCKHTYQDQKYGTGMRVMNATANKDKNGYRCTVCGSASK